MSTSYINPGLPAMIRGLWKSDPSEASVRTALDLAGDLIQELIDLKPRAEAAEATLERVRALEPTWHKGMYGCPQDMFSRDSIRAALAPVTEEGDKG